MGDVVLHNNGLCPPTAVGSLAKDTVRKVAFVYGARDKTWSSGTPYYLARALEDLGKKTNAFDVIDIAPKRVYREVLPTYLRWCLESGSTRVALFLLSQRYQNRCVRDMVVPENVRPYFVVWGQCIPSNILTYCRTHRDARIIRYTDATCLDLIESFDWAANPPRRVRERMIRDEKNSYSQADLIAVFHEDVRSRMIRCYDVPPEKISVVGRGVNLERELLNRRTTQRRSDLDHKFHMMVVGRGPKRKGIYRLIEAIDSLSADEQNRLVLTVAGPERNELPARPYLRPTGFISDRQREKLAAKMAASDRGVLLSEAESLPGSIWEFLALQVPVWVSKLPGIVQALNGFPAVIEDLPLSTPALAARLRAFLYHPDVLAALVAQSKGPLEALTWEGCAEFLGHYICYDRVPDK